mgnify:FL=1
MWSRCSFWKHQVTRSIVVLLNRDRETFGSWLGPSTYFDIYNYEGNLIYKVKGPSGYPCECTRDKVAAFQVSFLLIIIIITCILFIGSYLILKQNEIT